MRCIILYCIKSVILYYFTTIQYLVLYYIMNKMNSNLSHVWVGARDRVWGGVQVRSRFKARCGSGVWVRLGLS